MFTLKWFKKDGRTTLGEINYNSIISIEKRIRLLETHLGVEYFNGGKNKPHYRAKRVRKEK